MKTSLSTFIKGLMDLRHYIQKIDLESQLLLCSVNEVAPAEHEIVLLEFRENLSVDTVKWRNFNYNSIIISLYGYFEQFIESLIRAYVKNL